MTRKVQLRLLSSQKMSNREEHEVVRFPRNVRENFGFSNDRVIVGRGSRQVALEVRKAYKEDIRRLALMLQNKKISDKEAKMVGFVSSKIQRQASSGKTADVWISEGVESITIGADPEFGLVDRGGTLHRGSDILPAQGTFGSDGPGVEVRPPPDRNHLAVVRNIRDILRHPPPSTSAYMWRGGATFQDQNRVYWFGGHIHLGRPMQIPERNARPVYCQIATILDFLLALPMARFDTPDPHFRRNGCKYGYGKAGHYDTEDSHASIRTAPEGNRFEYRVLSGLWITHPVLTKIALGAAKCITETAYSRMAEQKFDPDWAQAPLSRKGLLRSFGLKGVREVRSLINQAAPAKVTQEHVAAWKRRIKELDYFETYAAELNALAALVEAAPTDFTLDVKRNWHRNTALLPKHQTIAKLRKALKAVEEK